MSPSPPSYGDSQSEPGLWLGLSIGATLLCCLPLGVVGIVYAAMALDANSRGDYLTARERTRQAKLWTQLSIGAGLAVLVIYICILSGAAERGL
ncbi:MAG TPA: hypothetical protein DGG94_03830 [Micromonosporaceae bacterium]|nr:hypothetical protein [Micromonosporaceae bacterium]HCU48929.1 hypothetical protein [Micromonosporaceae bacterium]